MQSRPACSLLGGKSAVLIWDDQACRPRRCSASRLQFGPIGGSRHVVVLRLNDDGTKTVPAEGVVGTKGAGNEAGGTDPGLTGETLDCLGHPLVIVA